MSGQQALYNGQPADTALAWSRGLHYGHGVFRTCLIYDSEVIDIEKQIEKLMNDAGALDLHGVSPGALRREARQLAQDQSRAVLKMMLLGHGHERGYGGRLERPERLLCRYPAPAYPPSHWQSGIRAFRSHFRLAAQPALAGLKHLNRLEQVLATRHWEPGCDEGIVNDDAGRPLCGTRSNLFWVRQRELRSPSLDRCGVAGLMRDKVLTAAADLGLARRVGEGSWEELGGASEIFVCNSLIGIWPVRAVSGWTAAAPGPVTRQLMEFLRHPCLETA